MSSSTTNPQMSEDLQRIRTNVRQRRDSRVDNDLVLCGDPLVLAVRLPLEQECTEPLFEAGNPLQSLGVFVDLRDR